MYLFIIKQEFQFLYFKLFLYVNIKIDLLVMDRFVQLFEIQHW